MSNIGLSYNAFKQLLMLIGQLKNIVSEGISGQLTHVFSNLFVLPLPPLIWVLKAADEKKF